MRPLQFAQNHRKGSGNANTLFKQLYQEEQCQFLVCDGWRNCLRQCVCGDGGPQQRHVHDSTRPHCCHAAQRERCTSVQAARPSMLWGGGVRGSLMLSTTTTTTTRQLCCDSDRLLCFTVRAAEKMTWSDENVLGNVRVRHIFNFK